MDGDFATAPPMHPAPTGFNVSFSPTIPEGYTLSPTSQRLETSPYVETGMMYGTPSVEYSSPYIYPEEGIPSCSSVDYLTSDTSSLWESSQQEDALINQHIQQVQESYQQSHVPMTLHEPQLVQETLPLQNGEEYQITLDQLDNWCVSFPNVDIRNELTKMKHWLSTHASKGRTKEKAIFFVEKWLGEEDAKCVHKQQSGETTPYST